VHVWNDYYYFWFIAFAGLIVLFLPPIGGRGLPRLQKLFVLFFLIASVCVTSAGFYFRQHYFVAILPAISLMAALFIEFAGMQISRLLGKDVKHYVSTVILILFVLFNFYDNNWSYYFKESPASISERAYAGNPFNEAQGIARYISDNTKDTEKVAILGSEPEIYFYANRLAATGYIYMYPLVENQPYNLTMQNDMIAQIEKEKPKFMVFCYFAFSWLLQDKAPSRIFDWINKYSADNYNTVGIDDYFPDSGWQMLWNEDLRNRTGKAQSYIVVFKRK
jgi:hypothetical protein